MSDPLERFERLAVRARAEAPEPGGSVAPDVLRRLRVAAATPAPDRPLWWVAAGAVVAAVFTVALNYSVIFGNGSDAVGDLAVYAGWIML